MLHKNNQNNYETSSVQPMKIPIFPGEYHQNGGFSMAKLVSRRVIIYLNHLSALVGFSDTFTSDEIHTLEHPKANTWKLKVMKEKGINDSPSPCSSYDLLGSIRS